MVGGALPFLTRVGGGGGGGGGGGVGPESIAPANCFL